MPWKLKSMVVLVCLGLMASIFLVIHSNADDAGQSLGENVQSNLEFQLAPLELARETLVDRFGKGHPKVKALDAQIKSLTQHWQRQPPVLNGGRPLSLETKPLKELRDLVPTMDNKQLRRTLQVLIDRHIQLEQHVESINRPRIELLK